MIFQLAYAVLGEISVCNTDVRKTHQGGGRWRRYFTFQFVKREREHEDRPKIKCQSCDFELHLQRHSTLLIATCCRVNFIASFLKTLLRRRPALQPSNVKYYRNVKIKFLIKAINIAITREKGNRTPHFTIKKIQRNTKNRLKISAMISTYLREHNSPLFFSLNMFTRAWKYSANAASNSCIIAYIKLLKAVDDGDVYPHKSFGYNPLCVQ